MQTLLLSNSHTISMWKEFTLNIISRVSSPFISVVKISNSEFPLHSSSEAILTFQIPSSGRKEYLSVLMFHLSRN